MFAIAFLHWPTAKEEPVKITGSKITVTRGSVKNVNVIFRFGEVKGRLFPGGLQERKPSVVEGCFVLVCSPHPHPAGWLNLAVWGIVLFLFSQ